MKEITKIVVTGGPCGGKTSAMKHIKEVFTKEGYTVLFISETATELISGGVAPWTCYTNAEYQCIQMKMQLRKEELYQEAAEHIPGDRFLIVCDRAELDNRAYMNDEEFAWVLKVNGWTEEELLAPYHAVFHLETAAKHTHSEIYSLDNNTARYETPEGACEVDDKLLKAWDHHPRRYIIHSSDNFDDKMQELIDCIRLALQTL